MTPLIVVGGGGHARVVIDTARSAGVFDLVGILDDHLEAGRDAIDGVPVLGPITPEALRAHGAAQAVIAIGSNQARQSIAARLDGLAIWATIIHPRACVAPTAMVGEGAVVFANAVVQPCATIGRHAILNTASSVDHDSDIAAFVHIGPGAHLAGNVTVGEGTLFGIGSCAIPGCQIGCWSAVGAGAAVVRDIPAHVTAVGVPATVVSLHDSGPRA